MKQALLATTLFSSLAFAQLTPTDDDEPLPGSTQAIQERAYRMSFEIGVAGGLLPVDPFTKQAYVGGVVAYHFSDALALQARGGYTFNWATGLRQQLERDFQVLPTAFEQFQFFAGGQVVFSPFYGKSALANRFVIHYEAYFAVGGGVMKTTKGIRPGIDLGGGLRVFQNNLLSYRLELIDSILVTNGITNALSVNVMISINLGSSE